MSRRSFILAIAIVVVFSCTFAGGLYALLSYEPGHYTRNAIQSDEQRTQLCKECMTELIDFWNALTNDRDGWHCSFTDDQINCYLDDEFVRSGVGDKLLPEEIAQPRVFFDSDRMRLAFRYRSSLISTVVSVTLRIWLPKVEGNVVAVKLESLRAGALPFKAQWLLEQISEVARQNGIEVTWYRHEGQPVALLRFQADQARSTLQLKAIQVESGRITIQGRTGDDHAALPRLRDLAQLKLAN